MGSATGPLLEWLERSVFPEQARFVDREYAATVAVTFCQRMACRVGHDYDRLRVAVVPRFALSCTPELLRGAARFARERY